MAIVNCLFYFYLFIKKSPNLYPTLVIKNTLLESLFMNLRTIKFLIHKPSNIMGYSRFPGMAGFLVFSQWPFTGYLG